MDCIPSLPSNVQFFDYDHLIAWSHFSFPAVQHYQGLKHFDEILKESDGVILARGNLGIDLPPEKVGVYCLSVNESSVYSGCLHKH